MLVLTRKIGEFIKIKVPGVILDEFVEIKVYVTKVKSGQVQLGFEAPKDVRIIREELENKS